MNYWTCLVAVFYVISFVECDSNRLISSPNTSKCRYADSFIFGNRSIELECCQTVVHNYYAKMASQDRYLSTFLESLQTWNCPQFKQECKYRTFNYTDFTSLMYSRFCNRSEMAEQCYDDILSIETKQNITFQTATSTFDELISNLDLLSLNDEDLMNPCVQVAMYDIDLGGHGHFHEIIEPVVPFCSFVWCGFDENVIINQKVSPWTCMPSRCRLYLILYYVANIILAVAIAICNATILGVIHLTKEQDVQTIYRLSLAVADLIMGLIVMPTNIGTMYKYLVQSSSFTESQNVTGFVITNDSFLPMQSVTVELKELKDQLSGKFSSAYLNAVGIFTVLSLTVSVYSLVAASLDRFIAISRPLRYNNTKAILAAKISVAFIWFAATTFAVLPIVVPDLGYAFVASKFATSDGKPVLIFYSINFFLPVLLMWYSITATYVAARPSLRKRDRQLHTDHEMRLLGTLGVMIAVFTLCILPLAVILIASAFLSFVDITDSENFDPDATAKFTSVELSLGLLLVSNSLWNCFIYSTRESNFRNVSKLLYKRIAQRFKLDAAWNTVSRRRDVRVAINT